MHIGSTSLKFEEVFVPVFAFLLFCVCVHGTGSRPGVHDAAFTESNVENEVVFFVFFEHYLFSFTIIIHSNKK